MFVTLWHLQMFLTLQNYDICVTLRCGGICLSYCDILKSFTHYDVRIFVSHHIATIVNFRHFVTTKLCLSHSRNRDTFITLLCYYVFQNATMTMKLWWGYVHHIETVGLLWSHCNNTMLLILQLWLYFSYYNIGLCLSHDKVGSCSTHYGNNKVFHLSQR